MSLVVWVEIAALVIAIVAALLSIRPPPPLDWERLFKVALATVIRGEVEAAGGDTDAWWARVKGVVPYQPAAQLPQAMLQSPDPDGTPVPAREGERALAAQLARLETVQERWAVMYEGGTTRDELLQDPAFLGPAYDPAPVLAPNVGWDAVAAWSADLQEALGRRMSDVVVFAPSPWLERLRSAAPHVRTEALAVPDEQDDADAPALDSALSSAADRCFIVTDEAQLQPVLARLHGDPRIRDRVIGVLNLGGRMDPEWLAAHFQHEQFDTELNRRTAYMSVVDVELASPVGHSWDAQRFPDPPVPPSGWSPIEAVDLGPLPLARQDVDLLVRALWVVIAFRLSRS